jgi:hypothetical protein
MIAGVQKSGTTALASFLDQHPALCMADPKEPHVFDSPNYSAEWTSAAINKRYARYFACSKPGVMRGEATPIYTLFPYIAGALKQYNNSLKLIVLLRDPVERAYSHHTMEFDRGNEVRPLWLALLLEPFRLRRDGDPRALNSAMRRHSYRTRGLYSRQLANLYQAFPPQQILLLQSEDLRNDHDATLERVFSFLGVDAQVRIAAGVVFPGNRAPRKSWIVTTLLHLSYLAERTRLRRLQIRYQPPSGKVGQCRRYVS